MSEKTLSYIISFTLALLISAFLTMILKRFLPRFGFMDRLESHSTHNFPAVRGGGIAIFCSFFLVSFFVIPIERKFIGLFLGSLIILIINVVDDWGKIKVTPMERLFWEMVGIFVVISSGIGIDNITNPLGGVIAMDSIRIELPFLGQGYGIMPFSDIFTIVWLILMINVLNWMDGLDGLASGVSAISAFTIFCLSILPIVNQPNMAFLSIILFGSILGFLPYNFFSGRIKLGDSGATFLGFVLGILAILNKGKVATFFLILGLPILDAVWVIFRRIFIDRKSPFKGDKKHFHHRLLKLGLSKRGAVYVIWMYSFIFAMSSLFFQGAPNKLISIIVMAILMIVFSFLVYFFSRNKPDIE